jgi:hypothetical protein
VISGEAENTNFRVFDLSQLDSNPQSTTLEGGTQTITHWTPSLVCSSIKHRSL